MLVKERSDDFTVQMVVNGFVIDYSGKTADGEWQSFKEYFPSTALLMAFVDKLKDLPRT